LDGAAADTFTTECSQYTPGKCGGANVVVQKEQTTTVYLEGKCSLVQEAIGTGAVGAYPIFDLDTTVFMSKNLRCSDLPVETKFR
jgi:hypothetical protein